MRKIVITNDLKNQIPMPFETLELRIGEEAKDVHSVVETQKILFAPEKMSKPAKRLFHYTKIDGNGKRAGILRMTLRLLLQQNPSTFEIQEFTRTTRASSDISELREQGFVADCVESGTTENPINRYVLTPEGREKAIKFFEGWEE